MDEWLTVAEAAGELGMHPGAVRKAIGAGRLAVRRHSPRVVLLARAEVERYKRERPAPGRPKGAKDKTPRVRRGR